MHFKPQNVLCVVYFLCTLAFRVGAVRIGAAIAGNAATTNTVLILASTTANAEGSPIKPCGAACVAVTGDPSNGNTWEACAQTSTNVTLR